MDTDGDSVADNCVEARAVTCPTGQFMVGGQCTAPVIDVPVLNPVTCPDGTPMTDVNGDGKLTAALDCVKVLPDVVTPAQPGGPPGRRHAERRPDRRASASVAGRRTARN